MNSKKLYHFLMNNECHLYRGKTNIESWVVVDFLDLKEFVEIIGIHGFDDGGREVRMFEKYIAVELNDLIENNDEELSDYKECFGSEWKEHFEE